MTSKKITGTKEAFSKMLEERGVYKKLGVERATVGTWKMYLKEGSEKGISEDKMKEMLFRYGVKLIKEPVYLFP